MFKVAGANLALRLRRPGTSLEEIARQVSLVDWLAANGFPVNRPAQGLRVLQEGLEGATASFWEWIVEDPQRQASVAELGALLRDLHNLIDQYPESMGFPKWNPWEEIEHRIHTLQGADGWPKTLQLDLLREWSLDTSQALEKIDWPLPIGLIHGDAHVGNVMTTRAGINLLIDFDAVTQGHREWDLVPTAVFRLRFQNDLDSIEGFTAAYGFDLLRWSGWPVMRKLREVYMTSWLMSVANNRKRQVEVEHRMRCLAKGDEQATWHAV